MKKNTLTRVAVTYPLHAALRDFAFAAGLSQGRTSETLLEQYRLPGESWLEAGRRLQRELDRPAPHAIKKRLYKEDRA